MAAKYFLLVLEPVPVERRKPDIPSRPTSVECGMVGINVGVPAHGWEERNR